MLCEIIWTSYSIDHPNII